MSLTPQLTDSPSPVMEHLSPVRFPLEAGNKSTVANCSTSLSSGTSHDDKPFASNSRPAAVRIQHSKYCYSQQKPFILLFFGERDKS